MSHLDGSYMSLGKELAGREEELRRLDQGLNEKKSDIVRRAEELVAKTERNIERSAPIAGFNYSSHSGLEPLPAGASTPSVGASRGVPAMDRSLPASHPLSVAQRHLRDFDALSAGIFVDGAGRPSPRPRTATGASSSSSSSSTAAAAAAGAGAGRGSAPARGRDAAAAVVAGAEGDDSASQLALFLNAVRRGEAAGGQQLPGSGRGTGRGAGAGGNGGHPQYEDGNLFEIVDELGKRDAHVAAHQEAVAAASAAGAAGGGVGSMPEDAAVDGIGAAALIRYQRARIAMLTDAVQKLTAKTTEQETELSQARQRQKASTEELAAAVRKAAAAEALAEKQKKSAADAARRLVDVERDVALYKREVERAQKSRSVAETEAKQRDIKLTRALQDADKAKAALSQAKDGEKEVGASVRADAQRLASENKRLSQQKADLLLAVKKQFKLIDILKKQIVHLEAARMLAFTEDEFARAIHVDTDDVATVGGGGGGGASAVGGGGA